MIALQVRRGTADRFGVICFNVKGKDNTGFEHLLALNQPDVKFIKVLDEHASKKLFLDTPLQMINLMLIIAEGKVKPTSTGVIDPTGGLCTGS